ncbi:UNVERIFIED_ORG: hypothetical protein J2W66_003645 [Agrobacterium larrymoorei]|nr:hypothetical protein [Agrobacterium larrymoorei]
MASKLSELVTATTPLIDDKPLPSHRRQNPHGVAVLPHYAVAYSAAFRLYIDNCRQLAQADPHPTVILTPAKA